MSLEAGQRRGWTLEEASQFCSKYEELASHYGLLLSIYGSTVRMGKGRDLDIILSQKRVGIFPEAFIAELKSRISAITISGPEASLFAEHCELLLLPDGRMLDIQVRKSRNQMDALDLYERNLLR